MGSTDALGGAVPTGPLWPGRAVLSRGLRLLKAVHQSHWLALTPRLLRLSRSAAVRGRTISEQNP